MAREGVYFSDNQVDLLLTALNVGIVLEMSLHKQPRVISGGLFSLSLGKMKVHSLSS